METDIENGQSSRREFPSCFSHERKLAPHTQMEYNGSKYIIFFSILKARQVMEIELKELLGKNYYTYVAEDMTKYEGNDGEDTFIMRPVVDFVFKRLFGDYKRTERLKSLLSSILEIPMEDLENLIITNSELPKDFNDDKYGRLDIKVILKDGKQINIEMQVLPFPLMPERTLYYWAGSKLRPAKAGEFLHETCRSLLRTR